MKLGERLSKYTTRKKYKNDLLFKVAADINNGLTAEAIAKKYKNPVTKKPYSISHMYLIIREIHSQFNYV